MIKHSNTQPQTALTNFPAWHEIGEIVKATQIESAAEDALLVTEVAPTPSISNSINAILEKHFGKDTYQWWYESTREGILTPILGGYRFIKEDAGL